MPNTPVHHGHIRAVRQRRDDARDGAGSERIQHRLLHIQELRDGPLQIHVRRERAVETAWQGQLNLSPSEYIRGG